MKSPIKDFFCLTAYASWAPVKDRERLALAPSLMAPFLKSLNDKGGGCFFYLSTCHRVEVYGYGGGSANVDAIKVRQAWCQATGASEEAVKLLRGTAALEHFVRVGAGLESEIVGERQIIGQVRASMNENLELGLLGSPLIHILQRGLRIARTVRAESRVGEGRENLSSMAIMSLHDIFESLADKKFVVVGAGSMALLAIEKLRELQVNNITWMNRSQEKIESHPYGRFCAIQPLSDLTKLVLQSDVTILATASPHPILYSDLFDASPAKRRARLKVILDLGLPRNAAQDVADAGFILRNVDEFKGVLADPDGLQKSRIEHAERIAARDINSILVELELAELGPLKTQFVAKWKWMGDEILLENSREAVYNVNRFWARLGHVLITKANQLGPLEGGQFLKQLCESFDGLDQSVGEPDLEPKVLHLPPKGGRSSSKSSS